MFGCRNTYSMFMHPWAYASFQGRALSDDPKMCAWERSKEWAMSSDPLFKIETCWSSFDLILGDSTLVIATAPNWLAIPFRRAIGLIYCLQYPAATQNSFSHCYSQGSHVGWNDDLYVCIMFI